jgi:hypothetical protein
MLENKIIKKNQSKKILQGKKNSNNNNKKIRFDRKKNSRR